MTNAKRETDSLPLLLEDGSRMDWPDAEYETEVKATTGRATVTHRLAKAPVLERLIERGDAVWAVEIRCPKTLLAEIETSVETRQVAEWDADDVDGDVFIMPGLLATRELPLSVAGLSSVYEGVQELRIPPGYWLAKGETWRASALMESMLTFRRKEDLEKGRMEVAADHGGGQLRFIVEMAPDVYEHRDIRAVRIAALVGVCAQFPREFGCGGEEDEIRLAQMLRDRLEHARPGVPLWDEPDNYDPALVATLIEPFRLLPASDGGDGE